MDQGPTLELSWNTVYSKEDMFYSHKRLMPPFWNGSSGAKKYSRPRRSEAHVGYSARSTTFFLRPQTAC